MPCELAVGSGSSMPEQTRPSPASLSGWVNSQSSFDTLGRTGQACHMPTGGRGSGYKVQTPSRPQGGGRAEGQRRPPLLQTPASSLPRTQQLPSGFPSAPCHSPWPLTVPGRPATQSSLKSPTALTMATIWATTAVDLSACL